MGIYNNEMELFFSLNANFKKKIENLSLRKNSSYLFSSAGNCAITEYADQINKELCVINDKTEFIMRKLNIDNNIQEEITKKINEVILKFQNCSLKKEAINRFYEENILNLSPNVCKKIDESFFAYNIHEQDVLSILKDCVTINDIIHFLHVYIATNEKFYQNIPINYSYKSVYNTVNVRGNIYVYSRILYKEYLENIEPMQYPVEILDIGNSILILAGTDSHTISSTIDLSSDKINIDFKISGDVSSEDIKDLNETLRKNGVQNLSIRQLKNGITGLAICNIDDLSNIISSKEGLINFVSTISSKYIRKK